MIQNLKDFTPQFFGEQSKLWLFGSRLDDQKRGGDIDLFVESPLPLCSDSSLWGERKIDLVSRWQDSPAQPIHDIAKKGVRLV